MAANYKIDEVVKKAKAKGYFALEEYPGLKLSIDELQKLTKKVKKLPTKRPGGVVGQTAALQAVVALRNGVAPVESVASYSVGREKLLDRFQKDLAEVSRNRSRVRFLNSDLGEGKTHALSLLREIALGMDFPVSLVTLSQSECPLHDFLLVYSKVMWSIRTRDERHRPALENIFQRWLNMAREKGEDQAPELIKHLRGQSPLRDNVVSALAAYCNATNIVSPNKEKQHAILDWFSAKSVYASELRTMGIRTQISEHDALEMLSIMAHLFKQLGYKGLCILFDEAEAIHSFSRYSFRDKAYASLLNICRSAERYPNCYFLYSTTPSFFDAYTSYWAADSEIRADHIYELERLSSNELTTLADKILSVYCVAYNWKQPAGIEASFRKLAEAGKDERVGDFVRGIVAFLDEKSGRTN